MITRILDSNEFLTTRTQDSKEQRFFISNYYNKGRKELPALERPKGIIYYNSYEFEESEIHVLECGGHTLFVSTLRFIRNKDHLKTEQNKNIKDRYHPIDRIARALVQVGNRNHSRELMIFNSVSEKIRNIIDKKIFCSKFKSCFGCLHDLFLILVFDASNLRKKMPCPRNLATVSVHIKKAETNTNKFELII